jgi:hypothetical protein
LLLMPDNSVALLVSVLQPILLMLAKVHHLVWHAKQVSLSVRLASWTRNVFLLVNQIFILCGNVVLFKRIRLLLPIVLSPSGDV